MEADEFDLVARRYCRWVELSDELDRDRFLRELERHLAALYLAAIDLPPGDADEPDAPPSMTHDEGQVLSQDLQDVVAEFTDHNASAEGSAELDEKVACCIHASNDRVIKKLHTCTGW